MFLFLLEHPVLDDLVTDLGDKVIGRSVAAVTKDVIPGLPHHPGCVVQPLLYASVRLYHSEALLGLDHPQSNALLWSHDALSFWSSTHRSA